MKPRSRWQSDIEEFADSRHKGGVYRSGRGWLSSRLLSTDGMVRSGFDRPHDQARTGGTEAG